jgi:hypothetical protein
MALIQYGGFIEKHHVRWDLAEVAFVAQPPRL